MNKLGIPDDFDPPTGDTVYPIAYRADLTDLDYTKEQQLAEDWICDGLRVSTGIVGTSGYGWRTTYVETFIFSDVPWQRTRQIHNYTANAHRALIAHDQIVRNLLKRAAEVNE